MCLIKASGFPYLADMQSRHCNLTFGKSRSNLFVIPLQERCLFALDRNVPEEPDWCKPRCCSQRKGMSRNCLLKYSRVRVVRSSTSICKDNTGDTCYVIPSYVTSDITSVIYWQCLASIFSKYDIPVMSKERLSTLVQYNLATVFIQLS